MLVKFYFSYNRESISIRRQQLIFHVCNVNCIIVQCKHLFVLINTIFILLNDVFTNKVGKFYGQSSTSGIFEIY